MINELLTSSGVSPKIALTFVREYEKQFLVYGINTDLEVVHFFAQILHESANLSRLREIWGPTKDQLNYERDFSKPWDKIQLAFRLGNDAKGDGKRYMGRGGIQRTGKYNHLELTQKTGIDFVSNPQWLELPQFAVISDLEYWNSRKLSFIANKDDASRVEIKGLLYNAALVQITKKINPGLRGLLEREKLLYKLKNSLSRIKEQNGGDNKEDPR